MPRDRAGARRVGAGWLDEPRNRELVDAARGGRRQAWTSQAPEPATGGPGRWPGKTFVLTGTLAAMSREEATAALERSAPR